MSSFTSLLLIAKARHRAAASCARTLAAWLEERGVSARILPANTPPDQLRDAANQAQAVIILGGDGTLVGAARKLLATGRPLLGINHGKVGFLAEVSAKDWEAPLTRLIAGQLPVVRRAALTWTLERDGRTLETGHAINDLVVGREALARVIALEVCLNGHCLGRIRADALVVGTPTGSTGYVLSAGGSLIHPDMDALSLTPVSPFQSIFPSMVLPLATEIVLRLDGTEGYLTLDGQDGLPLVSGDLVRVRGLAGALPLFVPHREGYLERLCACGFVSAGGPRRAARPGPGDPS